MIYMVSKKEHDKMVSHARKILEIREEAKWEICKIALKICYIPPKKGGRYDHKYSITNFAQDIGMNRKTLSCWLLDYQAVYTRLNIDDTKMSYTERKRFSGAITKTRVKLFNFDKISKKSIEDVSTKKVKETFKEYIELDILSKRLDDFIKNLSHHKYTFKNNKFNSKHKQKISKYREELLNILELIDSL